MRVIAGRYKGRVLKTVNNLSVRPATDRVKQTVFDMLVNRMEFDGAAVLDLFAGSGSLGIEGLSRGAERVVFVENNPEAGRLIEHNLHVLGCKSSTEIHVAEAMHFIRHHTSSYDLIFADPPYSFEHTSELPEVIFSGTLLKPDGYLLIEHATDITFPSTERYRVGPVKKFGRTVVSFFHCQGSLISTS